MVVSNVYPEYTKKELGKKLDVECSKTFQTFHETLKDSESNFDYLIIVYDIQEDRDEEILSKLKGITYDVLYERLLLVCDNDLLEGEIDLGSIDNKVIDFKQGFKFNDIVKELKEWYKEEIEEIEKVSEEPEIVSGKEIMGEAETQSVDLDSLLEEDSEEELGIDLEEEEDTAEFDYDLFEEDIVIMDKKEGGM